MGFLFQDQATRKDSDRTLTGYWFDYSMSVPLHEVQLFVSINCYWNYNSNKGNKYYLSVCPPFWTKTVQQLEGNEEPTYTDFISPSEKTILPFGFISQGIMLGSRQNRCVKVAGILVSTIWCIDLVIVNHGMHATECHSSYALFIFAH